MLPASPSKKESSEVVQPDVQPDVQIEAQQLSGGYDDKRIIEAVNLTLHQGEWLSLVGANGSGKSTLLRLLSRILSPQGGTVLLNGRAIHTQAPIEVGSNLRKFGKSCAGTGLDADGS